MKMIQLGELIEPARVRRAGASTLPILSMTMHEGLVDQASKFKKRVASEDISDYKVVEAGQLVVGFPIDEGVLGFQTKYARAVVSPAYGVWDLVDTSIVDPRFLQRYLRCPAALAYYRAKLRGSTARRRSLPAEVFLALRVPLPDIQEQQRIAAILDQADALRAGKLRELACLDELIQSAFLTMFGNPLSGASDCVRRPVGEVARVVTGNTPSRSVAENYGSDIEWIKSDNLGGLIASPADERLSNFGRKVARVAPPGSVLVTCIAGSPTSIGKASIVDREVAFNQQINAVLPSAQLRSRFFLEQLRTAPALVRGKSTGGMKGLVSKSSFESIEVVVPPLDLQTEFERRARSVDSVRARVSASLSHLDNLKRSLASRAFGGDF